MVQPQGQEERGLEIVNGDGIVDGGIAEVVGCAMDVTPAEASAGDPERESMAVVVAAVACPGRREGGRTRRSRSRSSRPEARAA